MAVYLVDFENVNSSGIAGIQKLTKNDKVYIFYTVNASNMSFAAHLNLLSSPAEVVYYNVASGGKNALDFQLASFLGYLICEGKEKKFCIISNDRGFEYVKTFWERYGVAADISISGSPSINRALMLAEKPYIARIQQTPAPEEIPEAEAAEAVPENVTNITDALIEKKVQTAPKKRGRPKKNPPKPAAEAAPAAEIPEPAAEPPKPAPTPKAPKTAGVPQALKTALIKAKVNDVKQINEVYDLLKKAAGKQQFYRGIIKIFGMERGVEVYKAVRPEYTNLTKNIK